MSIFKGSRKRKGMRDYSLDSTHRLKADAQKEARQSRDRGYYARVIKSGRPKPWEVWVNKYRLRRIAGKDYKGKGLF